jgi:hypothetical protein
MGCWQLGWTHQKEKPVLLLHQMPKPGQKQVCLLHCWLHQTRCLLLVQQAYQMESWEQQQGC